ncbi:MAG: ChaN family lipoprotein [Desulfobacterales bacterium]|nr:ChaN family lipoprotein [Desulfobacterales bacterium]
MAGAVRPARLRPRGRAAARRCPSWLRRCARAASSSSASSTPTKRTTARSCRVIQALAAGRRQGRRRSRDVPHATASRPSTAGWRATSARGSLRDRSTTTTGATPGRPTSAIFEYARAQRIPMIGLNVPREITRQVARGGFQSLTEAQRGAALGRDLQHRRGVHALHPPGLRRARPRAT